MTCRLYLTKGKRTGINYNHFIGGTRYEYTDYIVKKVRLGDPLAIKYRKEKVVSVYKYIVRDTKTYPVLEEGTDKKVKRTGYLPDKTVQVDSMKAPLEELEGKKVMEVEERYHNLGTLPIVELRNNAKVSVGVNVSLKLKTTTCHMVSSERDDGVCLPYA